MTERVCTYLQAESGQWEAISSPPCAAIQPFVHGPYTGWIERTAQIVRRREVPVLMVPLIISFPARFRIASPETADPDPVDISTFVAGAYASFSLVESVGTTCCVQVNLTYDGAYRLFRLPMHALRDRVASLEDLLGKGAASLVEQLGNARDWPSRFEMLDAFFIHRLLPADGLSAPIRKALSDLRAQGGRSGMRHLAEATRLAPKRLIREFHRQIGLPPKTMARLHRFDAARRRLLARSANLAEIALDAGYYDQAHFNREFRAFAGLSPVAYLAERESRTGEPGLDEGGNFVQDAGAGNA